MFLVAYVAAWCRARWEETPTTSQGDLSGRKVRWVVARVLGRSVHQANNACVGTTRTTLGRCLCQHRGRDDVDHGVRESKQDKVATRQ